jgi:hypothetical protein
MTNPTPDEAECPAGGPHVWVDDLTEAQLLTGLRPSTGWLIWCDECHETIRCARGGEP